MPISKGASVPGQDGVTNDTTDSGDGELRHRYLAMLSHDLRSAISSVIGGLSGINVDGLDQKSSEHRESALAAAIDVSRLLDGILDMEAIEKNEFALDQITTNLDEFLMSLQRRWALRAASKGLDLSVNKGIPLPEFVTIDANRLARAIGNVIENAIKYTEEGEVRLTVSQDGNQNIVFKIQDQGPGFSESALSRLFEFRGRPKLSVKPGTGLGLHIAKTLVTQMSGDIDVKNLSPRGAELKISVPILHDDAETEVSASVTVLPTTTLPDLSHLKILMAEDNLTNQLVVSQMLDAMGANFRVASDGVEAVALFETEDFNLALLDIEMPRMSGLDVIRNIRSSGGAKSSIPIIALTAYAMREHRERISAAGANGLIAKPILGIEDFGTEILRYAGHSQRKSSPVKSAPPTETVVDEDDADLIDMEIYNSLSSTLGADTMDELLSKVSEDLTRIKTGISGALETTDKEVFRTSSHILISVAGAIGALSTQRLAEQLNKAAHSGQLSDIRLVATGCLTNIDRLLKFSDRNRSRN